MLMMMQRDFEHHRQAHAFGLEGDAGTGAGGHAHVAAEGSADGGADGGDLVFRLKRSDAVVLVLDSARGECRWPA